MTRLPMGASFAPHVIHAVTTQLAQVAARTQPTVRCDTYVDNIRISSQSLEALTAVVAAFKAHAHDCGVTLNQEEVEANGPHTRGPWLGTECGYSQALRRLLPRSAHHLTDDWDPVTARPTFENLRVLFGRLLYVARVLRLPVSRWYLAIKQYRRMCAAWATDKLDEERPIGLGRDTSLQLAEWLPLLVLTDNTSALSTMIRGRSNTAKLQIARRAFAASTMRSRHRLWNRLPSLRYIEATRRKLWSRGGPIENNMFQAALMTLRHLPRGVSLPRPTQRTLRALKAVNPQLSGHGVKRGALQQATRIISDTGLPPHTLPLLAKHHSPSSLLPDPIEAKGVLAALTGTALTTRRL